MTVAIDQTQPLAEQVIEKLKKRFPKLNPSIRIARQGGADLPGSPWEILHDNKPIEVLIDRTILEQRGVDPMVRLLCAILRDFDYDRGVVKRKISQFPEVLFYARLRSLKHKDAGPARVKALNVLQWNWNCTREEAEDAIVAFTGEERGE